MESIIGSHSPKGTADDLLYKPAGLCPHDARIDTPVAAGHPRLAPGAAGATWQHGNTVHDGRGAVIKTVNKNTRRRLQKLLSRTEYARAERYFDVYAVVAPDMAVVTAAHRTSRTHLH